MGELQDLIDSAPNIEILNSILVTDNKLGRSQKPFAAISGGSDSDIVLHLCAMLDKEKKMTYVFYDTGLEFSATKEHLKYLEERYGIKIHIAKAIKPIPTCCRTYGIPFLSKRVSDYISRLQRYDFKWEDKPFDELYAQYPKCKAALKWWCNDWGENSQFNISYNKWLKDFLILNPPDFPISNKCCHYAKKLVAKRFADENDFDLNITGVRKAEGGTRATAYKNCFTPATETTIDQYRPVFWYKQETKNEFKTHYGIRYSDCYEVWGLPRTGCSGCPYAKDFESELEAVATYEPKLYKALNNVFGKSYEYTRKYRAFADQKKKEAE